MLNFCKALASQPFSCVPPVVYASIGSTRDEEPLVNTLVDRRGSKVLVLWKEWQLIRTDTAWGLLHSKICT